MLDFNDFRVEELMMDEAPVIEKESIKDIAVIGISAKMPLADSAEEYWENLKLGVDCIANFPDSRKELMDKYLNFVGRKDNADYSLGGHLKDVDCFDYRYFKISPKEASLMDPNQRLFLETAIGAIEDSGYGGDALKGTRTGVYLGYNADSLFDYKRLIYEVEPESGPMAIPGNLSSVIAGRLAYMLDLRGPSLTIDTACSSSLVAMHLACQGLRNGDCDMAIAGSVKLNLLPLERAQKLGIEASDGRTRTFDDSSDGTGMGEGVAAILLKPLSRAIEDNDNIYAVIKGSAINQDGSSIGLTAPNAVAQEDVIIKAWEDAGVPPETIAYIEAHGTGTVLGDPIEIDGIKRAFGRYTKKRQFCGIGSIKPNIGHLDNAAGIAGAIKLMLSLKNQLIPASINFTKPNRKINFIDSPVYVVDSLTIWEERSYPRRGGISAFGLSGTNCHIVLEEYKHDAKTEIDNAEEALFTLSAKSMISFKELLEAYISYLQKNHSVNLQDLCFTANTGRGHHQYRLAIIASTTQDLLNKIRSFRLSKAKELQTKGIFYSDISNPFCVAAVEGDMEMLAERYISGEAIDWKAIYKNKKRTKISAPTYCFEKSQCWLEIPEAMGEKHKRVENPKKEKTTARIEVKGRARGIYSDTEKALAAAWGEILGFKEISVCDNFYELGGDSISAMKLINHINKQMCVKAELTDVLKNQTIEEFAACLEKKYLCVADAHRDSDIEPLGDRPYYRLSSAQKRIFVLSQFEEVGTSYNISGVLELTGQLDKIRLQDTFNRLIQKHETLRTSFEFKDGEPVQIVHKAVEFNLENINGKEEDIVLTIKDFIRPFNLNEAPLLRVGVVEITADRHLLVLDMHHIISDGTSIGVLIKDMLELYRGEMSNQLHIQYKDFAEWQSERLASDAMKEQEAYWISSLEGELPVLNLPLDYPRPSVQSFEGDSISCCLDELHSQKLIAFARDMNTTPYAVLLAAYNVLLSKYTGQEDIIIGSLISGRNKPELEDLIGMFVNTLPLRNYPSGEKSFREFLVEVTDRAFKALDNQDCQFEGLLDKLDIPRDVSRNPLFDTLFVMQNMEIPEISLEGLNIKPFSYKDKTSRFDIALQAIEEAGTIRFIFEYCTKLFKQSTIEWFSKHFINLIHEITKKPDTLIKDISIIESYEKEQLLIEFNNTEATYESQKTIHRLIEEQAERYPEETAVVFQGESLTYKQLNERSNQLARLLREKGVKNDRVVAVVAERSLELTVAILAVLKAGGAYLPMNPTYPADRINYMLNDSQAVAVLTQDKFKAILNDEKPLINLNDSSIYSGAEHNIENISSPESLAYVIFTSGSTGNPKGVMVEHKALNNFIETIYNRFNREVTVGDRCLSLTNISFDVSVCELFLPLTKGATLVLFNNDIIPDIYKLASTIAEERITFAYIPPTILTDVCSQLKKLGKSIVLNKLLVGVEPIKDYVLEEYRALTSNMQIINGYGPTEATICATMFKYEGKEISGRNVPIGKPLQNMEIFIVDRYNTPVPVGVPGEICISGDGLARGYLGKPDMTRERFVPNPFKDSGVMYKTGDLASWLPDGNIEFIGRVDNQVKIRGYRIELGEIESQLLRHEAILEVTVIAREDKGSNKYLCAYFTSTRELSTDELRKHLSVCLPDFMLPSYYVRIDRIPLTPNGKVDRKSLPAPMIAQDKQSEYAPPRNSIEKLLADIWKGILGLEQAGINDSFFELGGDSIKAIKVTSLLQQHGLKLDIKYLFKNSTISELSKYVESSTLSIEQSSVVGESELLPIQRWFFEQSFTNQHHWNQAVMLHSRAGFAEKALREAMDAMMAHHDVLRSIFVQVDNKLLQVFGGTRDQYYTLDVYDLRDSHDPESSIAEHAEQLQSNMDIFSGPMVKLGLFKTCEGDHLLIAIHHLLVDGVSWRIILEDLISAYSYRVNNESIVLPSKTHSYKLWSSKLKEYSKSKELTSEIEFWRALEGSKVGMLADSTEGTGKVGESRTVEFSLSVEATDSLVKQTGAAYNTEVNELLLTALGYAIKDTLRVEKLPIMMEGHGRVELFKDVDISRTIGWFTAIYPFVLDMKEAQDISRQIKHIKEALRSIPNKGIGYSILKHASPKDAADIEFKLKPQVSFNYLGQFDSEISNDVFAMSKMSAGSNVSKNSERICPLDIYGVIAEGRLFVGINYCTHQFEALVMEDLSRSFEKNLLSIIDHCIGREAAELTPSDFTASNLDLEELDDLFDMLENS